ncbi:MULTISPECIES: hypothetical protein [unclassified Streptomyces]|uniref:hypothetical protein n=1 Tax=unclassified Streptomyces TaxID=2593676 RepID=UPI002023C911|nr:MULTISPECIES: hypothetical protein [unclassified Streptomyces]MCX4548711.1 hypothetical protein [Streptomyces sp. NBC_01500]
MTSFRTLKRIRTFVGLERELVLYDECDTWADDPGSADTPVCHTSLRISAFGLRAETDEKTGLAALKAVREQYPAVVHLLYMNFAIYGLLIALAVDVLSH